MVWLWGLGVVATLTAVVGTFVSLTRWWSVRRYRRAIAEFRLRREYLEARFVDLARQYGKPRGLHWQECNWQRDVVFAEDRQTGLLTAFVAVNIQFEAIPGGEMEGVPAVDTIRDAVALFHYQYRRWGTGGRALFNVGPQEAVERLAPQYEPLEAQLA